MPLSSLVRRCGVFSCALALSLFSGTALAHVQFIAPPPEDDVEPKPAQTVKVGSTFKLQWEVLIEHDPTGFDLDLLPEGEGSSPIEIEHGLPVATLEYDWKVPDMPCTGCVLRVTQRNTINDDYEGFAPIVISTMAGSDPLPSGGSDGKGGSSSGGGTGGSSSSGTAGGDSSTSGSAAGGSKGSEGEDEGGCSMSGRAPGHSFGLAGAALSLLALRRRPSRKPGRGTP